MKRSIQWASDVFDEMEQVYEKAAEKPVAETLLSQLEQGALAAFSAPMDEAKITVRLSPRIQEVRFCTAFSILNRLEKLDGAYNAQHPRATLEVQAPLGGRKGLMPIEALIAMLYPWLAVSETSTNEVAAKPVPAPASQKDVQQGKKRHILERLFGRKS